jgi:hypothetical protein
LVAPVLWLQKLSKTPMRLPSVKVLGLVAAISGGEVGAEPSDAEFQAWMAKPQVNFSKLGVTYWRVEEAWADRDTVVTIDDRTIEYSSACDMANFPYEQYWKSEGQLEVFPIWKERWCGKTPSKALLRFYFFLRQSDSAKSSGPFVAVGQELEFEPFIRLRRYEPIGLEFRRWIIAEYFDGASLTAPDLRYPDHEHPQGPLSTMSPPFIAFNRGDLEGTPSCGALMGGYALTGQSLKLHAGLFLRGWCPPNLLRQNDRVLAALRRATRIDPDGAQMRLRGDKDEVEVVLAPA